MAVAGGQRLRRRGGGRGGGQTTKSGRGGATARRGGRLLSRPPRGARPKALARALMDSVARRTGALFWAHKPGVKEISSPTFCFSRCILVFIIVPKEALPTGCYLRGPRYSSSGFFYRVLLVLLDTSGNFEKLQDLLQWTRGRGCRSATLLS